MEETPASWKFGDYHGGGRAVRLKYGFTQEDWTRLGTAEGLRQALLNDDRRDVDCLKKAAREVLQYDDWDLHALMKDLEDLEGDNQEDLSSSAGHVTLDSFLIKSCGAVFAHEMERLGESVRHNPISFNMDVEIRDHPIDSHRLILWARHLGNKRVW